MRVSEGNKYSNATEGLLNADTSQANLKKYNLLWPIPNTRKSSSSGHYYVRQFCTSDRSVAVFDILGSLAPPDPPIEKICRRNIFEIRDDYWPYNRPASIEETDRKEEDAYVAAATH
jgi:hypothetical protein